MIKCYITPMLVVDISGQLHGFEWDRWVDTLTTIRSINRWAEPTDRITLTFHTPKIEYDLSYVESKALAKLMSMRMKAYRKIGWRFY